MKCPPSGRGDGSSSMKTDYFFQINTNFSPFNSSLFCSPKTVVMRARTQFHAILACVTSAVLWLLYKLCFWKSAKMQSLHSLFNFILQLEKPAFKLSLPNSEFPASASKSCGTHKTQGVNFQRWEKECQKARGADFIPLSIMTPMWSEISYQSLLLFIHPLHHKQTRINKPKGSQNRSF